MCQEVKSLLVCLAQKAGFLYSATVEDPSFNRTYLGDGGIMILSRFPILVQEFVPYSFGIDNDGFTKRGILYAEIAVGGTVGETSKNVLARNVNDYARLHLFNTHMQSSQFNPPHDKGSKVLKESIMCRTE